MFIGKLITCQLFLKCVIDTCYRTALWMSETQLLALHFFNMFFLLLQFVLILFGYFLFGFIFGHLSVHFWSQHEQFSWWAFPVPVELKDTGTHTREWEDHTFAIRTNIFCIWSKYILQSGQIFFAIGTNTVYTWDKYI